MWQGLQLRKRYLHVASIRNIRKHLVRGFFHPGGVDVKLADGNHSYRGQKKAIRNLHSRRIDQFRTHVASFRTSELQKARLRKNEESRKGSQNPATPVERRCSSIRSQALIR